MTKIFFTLFSISFFAITNAQTNDFKASDAFIQKIQDRVSQIKAAEFSLKHRASGETSPGIKEIKGFFKIVPDDKAAGYYYFIQRDDQKMLYDGKNSYNMSIYSGSLNVADTKKYPDEAKLKLMSPSPFQNLLNLFEYQYGLTTAKGENHFIEDKRTVTVSTEKENDQIYYTLSCKIDYISTTTTIYVTTDYLPVKVVMSYLHDDESDFIIDNYTLLDTIPDDKFFIALMGSYNKISHYQGEENGYVDDEK